MAANAADSAARNIRNGAVDPVSRRRLRNVVIYGIGLVNAPYPLSTDFLERVVNDRRSPVFDNSKRAGMVLLSPTAANIHEAFAAISKILADMK